jgi:hypothetical protein
MKPWPNFLMNIFRHPAQASPDQSLANNSLKPNALVDQTEIERHPVVFGLARIR